MAAPRRSQGGRVSGVRSLSWQPPGLGGCDGKGGCLGSLQGWAGARGKGICPGHPLPIICNGSKGFQGWVGDRGKGMRLGASQGWAGVMVIIYALP
jgi:hypothetical protein